MASKQTRRSISISGETYDRLRAYCDSHNISMSGVIETEARKFLDMAPRDERLARPPVSIVQKTKEQPKPVVESPPTRVDKIREMLDSKRVTEAVEDVKKPVTPLAAIDAASKIFTF